MPDPKILLYWEISGEANRFFVPQVPRRKAFKTMYTL